MPPVVLVMLAAGCAWVAAEQVYGLLGGGVFISHLGDEVVVSGSAALCLAAGWWRRERLPWALLGAGLALWAVGDLYWVSALADLESIPVPSLADAGYLLFCPLAFAALALLLRARVRDLDIAVEVDAATAALAVGALAAATVFEAALVAAEGDALAVATNLAYALSDLALLGLVVAAVALQRWRIDRCWALLFAGVCVFWAADALYLVANAAGWYEPGGFFDPWWSLAALLFAAAAWQPSPARAPAAGRRAASGRSVILPLCFAAAGLGVLAAAAVWPQNALAIGLAIASLLAVFGRLAVSLRANLRLLEASRREAVTDTLTGLGNRRRLLRDLERAVDEARPERPIALALFDLDGFKHYNDSFGHPAGDVLLRRLGHRLARAVEGLGRAYRMGGDEFCTLCMLPDPDVHVAVELSRQALSEQGEGFAITSSVGSVLLPQEAAGAQEALRAADQRLYAHKRGGRRSARHQTSHVLVQALVESRPDLSDHLRSVPQLAEAVGRRLGLPEHELEQLRLAAQLHDVGKMAIPDAILNKPGPLDAGEWDFVKRHVTIGERILAAAPALAPLAKIVRASHERFDGNGYPDRLAGSQVPLAARIICVCDAYEAMTSQRPYASTRTTEQALAELRHCAGSQFDPAIVQAFIASTTATLGTGRSTLATGRAAPVGVGRNRS